MPQLAEPAAAAPRAAPLEGRVATNAAYNFWWLVAHHVLLRVGWIFKTESIVIPAFLSFIGGGPALLGWLPMLQRFGLSVPPLLYARQLTVMSKKKWSVVRTTAGMAAPFALLAAVWLSGVWQGADGVRGWVPYAFLAVYAVFFVVTGMNQLGEHSLSAKLVPIDLRGRLFAAGVMIGSPIAIAGALWALGDWLENPDVGFGWIFLTVATVFALAAVAAAMLREAPLRIVEHPTGVLKKFHAAAESIGASPDRKRLALLALLCSANFMLFPHYQAMGRDKFGLAFTSLAHWVALQNASTALFGIIAGPLADRLGNRAALRFAVFGLMLGPMLAVVLSMLPVEYGKDWFWVVFTALGFTPVTVRFLINYALEVATGADEARYVSAIGMCQALPVMIGSPIVGVLVGVVGVTPVMFVGWLVLLAAGLQTFRMGEPRHAAHLEAPPTVLVQ
ncbi:Major Facilitator Superfamily protein [Pirellulimonas nuda]|uniref:Major Facilitator Superfamily protein n=1 Tax=Pirellulimonas nuda TaxID=2528009 RepID=A0A518D8Q9_9BACT|nr:MFS transporter [Pirellulimonas nuda]QDU87862.1 Major Facilitator Superfamily protein [Pirellulimonas nuda]